jgi:hypothetical protein
VYNMQCILYFMYLCPFHTFFQVCRLIIATAVLHNFCVRNNIELLEEDEHHLNRLEANEDFLVQNLPNGGSAVMLRNNIVENYFTPA